MLRKLEQKQGKIKDDKNKKIKNDKKRVKQ